jgi:uncharacterized coiled-coil protein SlyX
VRPRRSSVRVQGPPARAFFGSVRGLVSLGLLAAALACAAPAPEVAPRPDRDTAGAGSAGAGGTHSPRDSVLEQRVARLELRLLERDAQLEELQTRLDEARQEVVRAMAKLQTIASRAEAASAIAEAEIAVQALRAAAASQPATDLAQATTLLQQASAEFAKQNYGGALYLANQAKRVAGAGRSRLGDEGRGTPRPGEVPFAVPVQLQATAHGNVRAGPGSGYKVVFTLDPGAALTGFSYVDQWVRITDESGRGGWIFLSLIGRRAAR